MKLYTRNGCLHCADAICDSCDSDFIELQLTPIPMVLRCPSCHAKHVDEPYFTPHRSHLCDCGTIWRPCDLPTKGVAAIATSGKNDNWEEDS